MRKNVTSKTTSDPDGKLPDSDMQLDFKKLRDSIDWSNRQLQAMRTNRLNAIKEYVGMHYGHQGSQFRVPTNFLELATTIYTQQLAARPPYCMVATKIPELKAQAYTMELALNQLPEELKLGRTFRMAVLEAIFGMGIVKVGITSSDIEVDGLDIGRPFADILTIDDYFFDMSAKKKDSIEYEGNDYWMPLEDVREMWEGKSSDISPDGSTLTSDQGNTRAESITSSEDPDEYRDKVQLRDVWVASKNKVITYAVTSKKVLNVATLDGPHGSPYHKLGFSDVPGNILPLPPAALWIDLHELGNNLFRKLGKQADRKKTLAAFAGGNDDAVDNLRKATDGEGVVYTGAPPTSLALGGIDAPTLAFFLQTRDLFSYFAGNLDTLGGLSPVSQTVGQDKLINEAASARIKYMSQQVLDFAKGIFKALAWYEWTDPERKRLVVKSVPGAPSLQRTVEWSAETRKGDFLDYNFDIDVHSMEDNTPSTKLQKLGMVMESYIMPLMPMMEQQGITLNFTPLFENLSKLANLPELMDILAFNEPPPQPQAQGNPSPEGRVAKPAHTTRRYERVNRPGATRAGKDDVLTRSLMGIGVQDSEMAAVGRPNT